MSPRRCHSNKVCPESSSLLCHGSMGKALACCLSRYKKKRRRTRISFSHQNNNNIFIAFSISAITMRASTLTALASVLFLSHRAFAFDIYLNEESGCPDEDIDIVSDLHQSLNC